LRVQPDHLAKAAAAGCFIDEARHRQRRDWTVSHLQERPTGRRTIAEEDADAEHAFAAYGRDLHQLAIAHAVGNREHAAVGEVDVVDATAMLVKRVAEDGRLEPQVPGDPVVLDCRQ
jgi:hypothetical protein